MKFKIHNPINRVTGSCYELVYDGDRRPIRILIDCGIIQGEPGAERLNRGPFPFEPARVDAIVLTHAHLDHCGLIPRLYAAGFTGPVFCTAETKALARLVLVDAASHGNTHSIEDVARIHWVEPKAGLFGKYQPLARDLFVRFFRTGHILGACAVQFVWGPPGGIQRRITFSGDLGPCAEDAEHLPLLRHRMNVGDGDYCVIESTYGDSNRSALEKDLQHRLDRLELELERAHFERGMLIIPCFAIGRTQDVLLDLQILQARGRLPDIPVFLDAVLAKDVCETYADHIGRVVKSGHGADSATRPAWLGKGLFSALDLDPRCSDDQEMLVDAIRETLREGYTPKVTRRAGLERWSRVWRPLGRESAYHLAGPAVVVTGGGMCDGGRVQTHLRQHLGNAKCTVLLTGYAAPATIAGRLLTLSRLSAAERAERTEKIGLKDSRLSLCDVQAKIARVSGYSAHADQAGLLEWLFARDGHGGWHSPGQRRVFITHGEPNARRGLADAIRTHAARLGKRMKAETPSRGAGWFDLDLDRWVGPVRSPRVSAPTPRRTLQP